MRTARHGGGGQSQVPRPTYRQAMTSTSYPTRTFLLLHEPEPEFFFRISGFRVGAIYAVISPGFLAPLCSGWRSRFRTFPKDLKQFLMKVDEAVVDSIRTQVAIDRNLLDIRSQI